MMPWNLLVNIFVAIIDCHIICECFSRYALSEKKNWLIIAISVACYLIFSAIVTLFISILYLTIMLNIVFLLLMSFAFNNKFKVSMVLIIAFTTVSIGLDFILMLVIAGINGVSVSHLLTSSIEAYALIIIMCEFSLYTIFKLMLYMHKNKENNTSKKYWVLRFIFPLLTIIILFIESCFIIHTSNETYRIIVLTSPIVLTVCNIILFMILDKFEIKEKLYAEKEKRIFELELERKLYEQNTQFTIASNKNIHELKNKIFVINEYLINDSPMASQLVGELCHQLYANQVVEYTGMKALNALLNVKFNEATENNIIIKKNIFCGGDIRINEIDLCVVIGNLLSNALEAVASCDNRKIELSIINKLTYLSITLRNFTKNENILIGKSTKADKEIHGFGLQNIQEVVEKYDGSCVYSINNGIFSAIIMLKNC